MDNLTNTNTNDGHPPQDELGMSPVLSASQITVRTRFDEFDDEEFWYLVENPYELFYTGFFALQYRLAYSYLSNLKRAGVSAELPPGLSETLNNMWASSYDAMCKMPLGGLRVSKKGKDFQVYLPVQSKDTYQLLTNLANTSYDPGTEWVKHQHNIAAASTALLPQLLVATKPVDIRMAVADMLALPKEDMLDSGEVTDMGLSAFYKFATELRIVSPPLSLSQSTGVYDPEGKIRYDITDTKDPQFFAYSNAVKRSRTLIAGFTINIPGKYVEYLCQKPYKEVTLSDVGQWVFQWLNGQFHGAGYSYCINPLSNIRATNSEIQTQSEYRANPDGIAISIDGDLFYVPDVDNVEQYERDFDAAGLQPDGDWTLTWRDNLKGMGYNVKRIDGVAEPEPKKQHFPSNLLIYTDWRNLKIAYSNDVGALQIFDAEQLVPASDSAMLKLLDVGMFTPDIGRGLVDMLFSHLKSTKRAPIEEVKQRITQFFGLTSDSVLADKMAKSYTDDLGSFMVDCRSLVRRLAAHYEASPGMPYNMQDFVVPTEAQIDLFSQYSVDTAWKIKDCTPTSPCLPLALMGEQVALAYDSVFKGGVAQQVEILRARQVLNGMRALAVLYICATYAPKHADLEKRNQIRVRPYKQVVDTATYHPTPAAAIKDDFSFLPHQAKNDAYLNLEPDNAIISTDAGGGKTLQILKDALALIHKGRIKRPLVACPGFLVGNYVEEVAYLTNGTVNVVVLNTDTLRVYGEDHFIAMFENMPPNTIVVTDYDFIKGRASTVPYGNFELNVSQNTELLKRYNADALYMDESHYLRNSESQRSVALQRLAASIPIKRLATGTFVTNQISDVVGQFQLFDPSVFGSLNDFIATYAEETVGNRVVSWKDGAEAQVRSLISDNSRLIVTKRKEWQFLLPRKVERFFPLELTAAQRSVYSSILADTMEAIRANKELMEKLQKAEENDEVSLIGIEMLLRPYLQRLEMFLSAPGHDKAGAKTLKGDDLIGPKSHGVIERIREHIAQNIPGKILIFSQYLVSATAVYEALPPDLKARFVHYTAANKERDMAKFKRDPNILGLIGVETSLNTGRNLQEASRIIRLECVWNPGTLEQAESRINRPDPKNEDKRTNIYLDWLVVNSTIDVTKVARLISKVLYNVRFDEANNPLYSGVPTVPIISMTLDRIENLNNWDILREYMEGYKEFKLAEKADYAAVAGSLRREPVPVPPAPVPKGSRLINVPYIRDHRLARVDELGVVPYLDYAAEQMPEADLPLVEYEPDVGLRVHTEYGDGQVVGSRDQSLRVKLVTNNTVTVNKLKVFVITGKDKTPIKDKLAKLIGLPTGLAHTKGDKNKPLGVKKDESKPDPGTGSKRDTKVETLGPKQLKEVKVKPTKIKKPVPNTDSSETGAFNAYLTVVNNTVAVGIDDEDPDVPEAVLNQIGFRFSGPYIYAHIPTAAALRKFLAALEAKYTIPGPYAAQLHAMQDAFNVGRTKLLNVQQTTSLELRNFFRAKRVATPVGTLKPYPVVQDGDLYICFDISKQPSAKTVARKIKIPSVRFEVSDGEYYKFTTDGTKAAAKAWIDELIGRGFTINNLKDVKEQYREIRLFKAGQRKE